MAFLARSWLAAIVQQPNEIAWLFNGHSFAGKEICLRCEDSYH
jgi:hypothetical protein